MPVEVLMPVLSPTMVDGKILSWKMTEGESVDTSSIIAEIETDKAVMELEAPCKGILSRIIRKDINEQIKVGTLIAVVAKKGETEKDVENFIKNFNTQDAVEKKTIINDSCSLKILESSCDQKELPFQPEEKKTNSLTDVERIKASPLARKIAIDNNIKLTEIPFGSGPLGRIIKEDIERFLTSDASDDSLKGGIFKSNLKRNSIEFIEIQNSSMRKAIATRLTQSKQQIPHFYISFEVKMNKLLEIRNELNAILLGSKNDKIEYKISINDMITKATAIAIEKNPKINSSWREEKIIQYNNVDVCVAVAIDNGLVTPIVRNCNQKGLVAISQEIKDLAKRAKEGKLKPEEFQGGGFTISNLGNYSHISSFTAIINPPQVAILSVSAIQEKAIVQNGKVEIAQICQMQISADHRALDGADIAKFTFDIKDIIENKILSLIL